MSGATGDDAPLSYALRILPRAERDIEAGLVRFADLEGIVLAVEWQTGLFDALATLAKNPRRCPIAQEQRHFRSEVRQHLYRRTPSSVAYRVLFTVQEGGLDAPTVSVIPVRHASARPISLKEAREIEAQAND